MKNLYEILGIKKNASKDDIRRGYRSKSMILHPDRGGSADRFAELEEANRILSDDETRAQYDRSGSVEKGPPPIEKQAKALLGSIFLGIVSGAINEGVDLGQIDMITSIKKSLEREIKEKKKEKKIGRGIIDKTRIALSRVSMKTSDGENALAGVLEAKINQHEVRYLGLEQDITLHEKAIEQLASYDYRFDVQEQPGLDFGTSGSSFYGA